MKISLIKPYPNNAKKHPKKQIQQVANSIKQFGFNQPIVVDEKNVIIVGHGRYEAAKLLGMTEVPVITVKLNKQKSAAYRLADNKLNESDWDMEMVIEELKILSKEMFDLTGFDKDLIIDPDNKDDEIPEIPLKTFSKLGDIYQLGNHRIICGDSTKEEDIESLLDGNKAQMCFTDPPYNVDYKGGGLYANHKKGVKFREGIKNDKMNKGLFREFLLKAIYPIVNNTVGGIYICMSSSEISALKDSFEEAGGHWQSFIIWVKNNFTLSRSDYQNTYEPIL